MAETLKQLLERGIAAHRNEDLAQADTIYRQILDRHPNQPTALQLLGLVEKHHGNAAKAERLMRRSVEVDPNQGHVWANLARHLKGQERNVEAVECFERARGCLGPAQHPGIDLSIALSHARRGDLDATLEAFERFFFNADKRNFANLNDICNLYNLAGRPQRIAAALETYFQGRAPLGPCNDIVFFFSLPKSAGTSIAGSFASTAGRQHAAMGMDVPGATEYSAGQLSEAMLDYIGGSSAVIQSHALPTDATMDVVRRFGGQHLYIHVRDPRDALVSYYHMAEDMDLHRFRMMLADPGYGALDRAGKLAWMKRRVYPVFVRFIRDWVAIADAWPGVAHVGTFETFVQDKQGYISHCANRLDGRARPVGAVRQTHMRRGQAGSAAEVFTHAEMTEMLEQIPAPLRERFGWS